MKTILVTGGAGFIGSNFVHYMLDKHPQLRIVDLDALTYAGNLENLADLKDEPRHIFVRGDIGDRALVGDLFRQYDFDAVVNFAAESHVDRSITQPELFLTTNVLGTQTLLDAARRCWSAAPDDKYCRDYREGVKFLQVSTDEVYGALGGHVHRDDATVPQQPLLRCQGLRGHDRPGLSRDVRHAGEHHPLLQ